MTDIAARYEKAAALVPHKLKALIDAPTVKPSWTGDGDAFTYVRNAGEFVLVDPVVQTKTVLDAPDAKTIANAVAAFSGETLSPDGRWGLTTREHNLWIRNTETDDARQLTFDGEQYFEYARMNDACGALVMQQNNNLKLGPAVVWSPDNTRFITHRSDQRHLELMHLVRSAPFDGGRPEVMSYPYALVGEDNYATAEYFVFDAASGEATQVQCGSVYSPFVAHLSYDWIWWSADGESIYWISTDRGDHNGTLQLINPSNGELKVLLEESNDTNIHFHHPQNGRIARTLSTGEIVWWSERTGWGHLYLYGTDGSVKTLTSGDWTVRNMVTVDEVNRRVVFTGSGREAGKDLYLQDVYSVALDGSDLTRLTDDELDHECSVAPSGTLFVDCMSNVDTPAIAVVRDLDGEVVMELETADASKLYEAGYTPGERVVVKAADGVTDIYCTLFKPQDFDETKTYPVVEEIYPGPQINYAPTRFPQAGGTTTGGLWAATFAALGFVHVTVDGRGHTNRSKAFRDHARNNTDVDFVADHVAAIKQLAETRPWMDIDRGVGIYGHSHGGWGSARSMLVAPDFYKVCVSSAGDHDDRVNHLWWGEKYYGLADEFDFEHHSNQAHVENLTDGKLFLVHGEMDDNAVPHGTMLLVKALIEANKDFDLLIIPNADHSMMVNRAYFVSRRWDYFVRHLMGETPPTYRLEEFGPDAGSLAATFA